MDQKGTLNSINISKRTADWIFFEVPQDLWCRWGTQRDTWIDLLNHFFEVFKMNPPWN